MLNTKYKNWYVESNKYLISTYNNDDIFLKLLAATSPRKSVKANINLAKRIYLNYLNDSPIFKDIKGLLNAHIGNIGRTLNNEPLSGLKVKNFYENLKGNLKAVTIDIWVKRYFNLKDDFALTPKRYKDLSKKIKNNAKALNLEPAEYQAVIWQYERSKAGFKPISFKDL